MTDQRACGVLLHPTSLPGAYGIGELGSGAFQFIDFLENTGMKLWQVLPLGPTGYGDSPYASFSTFAGNPLLISLERLQEEGFLSAEDLADLPESDPVRVDYGAVHEWKTPLINKAARNFLSFATTKRKSAYQAFCREEADWLDSYALFMSAKEYFQEKAEEEGAPSGVWNRYWDKDIALKEPKAVKLWTKKLKEEIEIRKVWQFFFFEQWTAVRQYANDRGIEIIGDIPIFVAEDSVDVWANRRNFLLDDEGLPTSVAGVPPDYFSATGQLWGNPLYDWDVLEKEGFQWWINRIKGLQKLYDIVRIDHFRGFDAYWKIPAGEETAIKGKWIKAPGAKLFRTIKKELGDLPIIAEDLGHITPGVIKLRDKNNFPGMKILQFAFDAGEAGESGDNNFLPHNYSQNCVVYTGTHDNNTSRGWVEEATSEERDLVRRYLNCRDEDMVWSLIRTAVSSTARYAVIPMQDLLYLPSWARMNTPSTLGGSNWCWRLDASGLSAELSRSVRSMIMLYGRLMPKNG